MYAHYFKQGTQHILIVSAGPQPVGKTYKVASKAQAKATAKANNLKPYNF